MYSWICGILLFVALDTLSGANALQCYECYNNTATYEDCRHAHPDHRKQCPPGQDSICVTNVLAEVLPTSTQVAYSRYCQRLNGIGGKQVRWPAVKEECTSTREGHRIVMHCNCNSDLCNGRGSLSLPDGVTLFRSTAATSFLHISTIVGAATLLMTPLTHSLN